MGGDDAEKLSSSHHHRRRSGIHFPIGSSVEVRTDDEGFVGAYFSATVISAGKTSEKLYVEYHDLLAREGGSDRLREQVNAAFVRPTPPLEELVKGFEPDDAVDAYYKDAWWNGVVSRVVEGGERFVVKFQKPDDDLEFGVDELRAHWEWDDGKWVKPQSKGLMFDVGREVELCIDTAKLEAAWFPATIQQDMGDGVFMAEYTRSAKRTVVISSEFLRPCPPLLKNKEKFILTEKEVDSFFDFGWLSGVITKELENGRYVVFLKDMNLDKEFNLSELRPHMKFKDGKWWLLTSDDDGVHADHNNTSDNEKMTTKRRRNPSNDSEAALLKKKLKEGNVEGANQEEDETTVDQPSYNSSCKTRISKSIRSKRVTRNIKRTLPRMDQEKGLQVSAENHSLDREDRQSMSEKIAVQVQEDPLEGKMILEIDQTVELEKVVNGVSINEFDDECTEKIDSQSLLVEGSRLSPVSNVEECMKDGCEKQSDDVDDSGRQASALVDKSYIESNEPQILPCVRCVVNKTVGVVLYKDAEEQEPQCLPCVEDTVGVVLDESSEKQEESVMQASSALVNEGSMVPIEPQSLPFLWKTIESMEVFQRMPQKPHFKPLEHLNEILREGLAIGHMATFACLVEKISRLRLNDQRSIMDEMMETLAVLESHGFDVSAVRDSVTKLIGLKDKKEKLVDEGNKIRNQILESNHEKTRIEKEIREIHEQISKLQEKVSLAESAIEKEDEEIASLQARLEETEENIKNLLCSFDGFCEI